MTDEKEKMIEDARDSDEPLPEKRKEFLLRRSIAKLVRRGEFKAAQKAIDIYFCKYGEGGANVGDIWYYKLLAEQCVTNVFALYHVGSKIQLCKTVAFQKAMQYGGELRQNSLRDAESMYDQDPTEFYAEALQYEKDGKILFAASSYVVAGERSEALRLCKKYVPKYIKGDRYEDAIVLMRCVPDDPAFAELMDKVLEMDEVYRDFKKAYPSPKKTTEDYLKREAPEALAAYNKCKETAAKNGVYHQGVVYDIALVIAIAASVVMAFGPLTDSVLPYLVWGIAMAVVLHIAFMWDFGIFKSFFVMAGATLVPTFAVALSDELLSRPIEGVALAFLISTVVLLVDLNQLRREKCADKMRKSANEIYDRQLLPVMKKQQKAIIDQYSGKVGADVARRWAKRFLIMR